MTIQEVRDYVVLNGTSNVTFTALVTRVVGANAFLQDETSGIFWGINEERGNISDLYPDIQVGNIVTIQSDCTIYDDNLKIESDYINGGYPFPNSVVLVSSGNTVTPRELGQSETELERNSELLAVTGTVTEMINDGGATGVFLSFGISSILAFTHRSDVGSRILSLRVGQEVTVVGNQYTVGGMMSNVIMVIDENDIPEFSYSTIAEVKDYVLNNGMTNVNATLKGVVSRSINYGTETYVYYIQDDTGAAKVVTQTPLSEFVSGNEVVFDGFFSLDYTGLQCGFWMGEISNIRVLSTGNTVTPITLEEAVNNPDINRYKLTSIFGTLSGVSKSDGNLIQSNFSYNEQDLAITFENILNSTTYSEINDGSTFTANGIQMGQVGENLQFSVLSESDLISYTKVEPEFQMKEFTGGMFLKQKDVNPKFSKVKFLNQLDYETLITDPSTAEANAIYYKSKVGSDIQIVSYSYDYDSFPALDSYGGTVEPAKVTVFQDSSVESFSFNELYEIFTGNFTYDLSDSNNLLSRISRLKYFHMVINAGVDAQFNGFTEKSIVVDLSLNVEGRIFFKVVGYYYYYNSASLPQVHYFVLGYNIYGDGIQSIGSSYERDTIGNDLSNLRNNFNSIPVVLSRMEPDKYLISNVEILDGGNGYQVGDTISFTLTDTMGTTFDFNCTVAEVYEEEWRPGGIKRLSGIDYDTIYEFDLAGAVYSPTTSGLGLYGYFRVKTRYVPGDYISLGTLSNSNEKDPLVQQSYVDLAIKNAITGFLEEGEIEV